MHTEGSGASEDVQDNFVNGTGGAHPRNIATRRMQPDERSVVWRLKVSVGWRGKGHKGLQMGARIGVFHPRCNGAPGWVEAATGGDPVLVGSGMGESAVQKLMGCATSNKRKSSKCFRLKSFV